MNGKLILEVTDLKIRSTPSLTWTVPYTDEATRQKFVTAMGKIADYAKTREGESAVIREEVETP